MFSMDRIRLIPLRILVTGSRGKSSVVRLLSAALSAFGLNVRGRITGVLPRELRPGTPPSSSLEETLLLRSGPTSVEEMRWWLHSLPSGTDAVVMENSAVAPELQPLAFLWLKPNCSVLTNVRPDHEEVWGKGEENAARALCSGIGSASAPEHPVFLPGAVAEKPFVRSLLSENACRLLPCEDGGCFQDTHLAITGAVCGFFGFDERRGRAAAAMLPPDIADFALFREEEGLLAAAFSANDPESTEQLFRSVGWSREETTILFNARKDRVGRLGAFLPWLRSFPWKKVCLTGGRPLFIPSPAVGTPLYGAESLARFVRGEGKVFGCGNVAGTPLEYLESKREEKMRERRGVVS